MLISSRSQKADGVTQARRTSYQALDYACVGRRWFYSDSNGRNPGVDWYSESMVLSISLSKQREPY